LKKILITTVLITIVGLVAVFFTFKEEVKTPDTVAIHYTVQTAMESGSIRDATIIHTEFLAQVIEDMDTTRRNRDNMVKIFVCLIIFSFVMFGFILYLYYENKIGKPFRKLQYFAKHIAAGNLDLPLEMDKDNIFGAFTESFDLMREELLSAREKEIKADKSKKELIASLVHDITTPVASVRSAIDILRLKTRDENDIKMLDSANKKLEQIDTLITDMFHSTLEELQELKVNPDGIQSIEIRELIKQADYEKRTRPYSIPDCIIIADSLRLQQVFDNILKNSYKYAGTDIAINAFIEEEYLFIEIQDFGPGVSEKELPLITSKFYRGENTAKTDGYGLGLYLSKYFMEKMKGGLSIENRNDGFMVIITLRLA